MQEIEAFLVLDKNLISRIIALGKLIDNLLHSLVVPKSQFLTFIPFKQKEPHQFNFGNRTSILFCPDQICFGRGVIKTHLEPRHYIEIRHPNM